MAHVRRHVGKLGQSEFEVTFADGSVWRSAGWAGEVEIKTVEKPAKIQKSDALARVEHCDDCLRAMISNTEVLPKTPGRDRFLGALRCTRGALQGLKSEIE